MQENVAGCGPGLNVVLLADSWAQGLWGMKKKKESSLSLSVFLFIKTSSRFDPVFRVVLVAVVGYKEAVKLFLYQGIFAGFNVEIIISFLEHFISARSSGCSGLL